jgi:hypothetical protein
MEADKIRRLYCKGMASDDRRRVVADISDRCPGVSVAVIIGKKKMSKEARKRIGYRGTIPRGRNALQFARAKLTPDQN